MNIPEQFQLAGQTVKVTYDKDLLGKEDMFGCFDPKQMVITVNSPGIVISKERAEQAFFHELVHAILDEMGELKLSKNERFVDSFSTLLHQAIKTFQGQV